MGFKKLRLPGLGGPSIRSSGLSIKNSSDIDKLLKRIQQKQAVITGAGQGVPPMSTANTTLQNIFDFIARPSHASAALANAALNGGDYGNVLKALEGQDKTTYSDVLGNLGMQKGIPRSVLGFIGDIALDPLTYIGVGAAPEAAKGLEAVDKLVTGEKFLKFAGEPVVSLAPVQKAAAPIFKAIHNTKIGELFERAFQHGNETDLYKLARNNPEEFNGKVSEFLNSMEKHLNEQKFESAKAVKTAEELGKKHTPAELAAIGTGDIASLPEHLYATREAFTNGFKEMANKESELGILGNQIEEYMPRIARTEGIAGRRNQPLSVYNPFTKERKYETFEEFNQALQKRGLEPVKNAATLYAIRGVTSARAISTKKIIDDAIRLFGTPLDEHALLGKLTASEAKALKALGKTNTKLIHSQGDFQKAISKSLAFSLPEKTKGHALEIAPELLMKLPKPDKDILESISLKKGGAITSGKQLVKNVQKASQSKTALEEKLGQIREKISTTNPTIPAGHAVFQTLTGGKLYSMPEEAAKFLNNFKNQFLNDEATKEFLRFYDKTLNVWKGWATAANPGFHGRNFLSNIWQNWLAGVKNPDAYRKAIELQRTGGNLDMKIGKYTAQQLFDMAQKRGVLGHGWAGSDIEQYLTDVLSGKGKFNPGSQNFLLLKKGRQFGTAIEDNARLAHFIDRIEKGYSPDAAAASVKKFLFDYQELTPFERNVMKRVIPFYTWIRKNIPLQIEQLAKQPGKFAAVPKAKQEIENLSPGINEASMPDWLKELYGFRLPIKTKSGQPLFVNPNLPFQDLGKITDIKDWLSSLSPAIKIPMETLTNQQFYWGTPIEAFPGQTRVVPGFFAYFPKAVQDKLGITMQKQSDGSMKPEASPWISYAFQQIPFLNNLGKATQAGDKRAYDMLSWLVGVKLIPLDEEKVKKQNLQNYARKLQSLTSQIERQQDAGVKTKKKNQNVKNLLDTIKLRGK